MTRGASVPFDADFHRLPGARRRQNRVITLLQEFPGRCDRGVGHDLDAAGLDHGDLPVDDAVREPILRDAVAQHPPRPGKPLEHGNGVSQPGQVVGRRQAAGPGADDGHPLAGRLRLPFVDELAPAPLIGRPFQHPDRDRLVELDARALAFAGMNAGMAAYGGKGDLFADHGQRPVEVPVPDMPDVPGNIDARGTGFSARGDRCCLGRLLLPLVLLSDPSHPLLPSIPRFRGPRQAGNQSLLYAAASSTARLQRLEVRVPDISRRNAS